MVRGWWEWVPRESYCGRGIRVLDGSITSAGGGTDTARTWPFDASLLLLFLVDGEGYGGTDRIARGREGECQRVRP